MPCHWQGYGKSKERLLGLNPQSKRQTGINWHRLNFKYMLTVPDYLIQWVLLREKQPKKNHENANH
jgi:hypothetical protein